MYYHTKGDFNHEGKVEFKHLFGTVMKGCQRATNDDLDSQK